MALLATNEALNSVYSGVYLSA